MNKAELLDALEGRLGSRRTATDAVEAMIDVIIREVAHGGKVAVTGFGTFEPAVRAARTGRNPRTGETVRIDATTTPRFRPGTQFKEVVADPSLLPAGLAGARAGTAPRPATDPVPAAARPARTRPARTSDTPAPRSAQARATAATEATSEQVAAGGMSLEQPVKEAKARLVKAKADARTTSGAAAEKPAKANKPAKADKPAKAEKPANAEKHVKAEKPAKAEKADKGDKSAAVERPKATKPGKDAGRKPKRSAKK